MNIRILAVATFLPLLLAACVPPASKPAEPEGAAAFISHSAIFFPSETASFELSRKYKYPVAADGVQLTYAYAPLPKAEIDFFVVAAGRGPQDEVLKAGMRRIRGEISAATKAGLYADTVLGDETDATATGADGKTLPGRRLQLSYTLHDAKAVSVAYMFYKQLYFVELRITAPTATGSDALLKAGDLIANEVVPRIHILSEGDCEKVTAHVASDADPKAVMAAVEQGIAEREAEGCPPVKHQPADFQPKQGEDAMQLSYTAADW